MKEENVVRNKWLHVRLSEEEYNKIEGKFSRSTCRKKSEFVRSILLDKVITVNVRNQSIDEGIEELIRLREELSVSIKPFDKAIAELHTLEKKEGYNEWLLLYEGSRKILLQQIGIIKEKINQLIEVWLQS